MSTELKGEALKARAKELGVWKSKMSADELREAIKDTEESKLEKSKPPKVVSPWSLSSIMDRLREGREARSDAGREAGSYDIPTLPMSDARREDAYREMNNGGAIRPGKQARRLRKKANKANG